MSALSLNKMCRYCPSCDLLITHRDEIEAHMTVTFATLKPEVVGNEYLALGTMDRANWKRGLTTPLTIQETVVALHDFAQVVRFEPARWVR